MTTNIIRFPIWRVRKSCFLLENVNVHFTPGEHVDQFIDCPECAGSAKFIEGDGVSFDKWKCNDCSACFRTSIEGILID